MSDDEALLLSLKYDDEDDFNGRFYALKKDLIISHDRDNYKVRQMGNSP